MQLFDAIIAPEDMMTLPEEQVPEDVIGEAPAEDVTVITEEPPAAEEETPARYQYPIDQKSENWFDYTVSEKSEMLKIPQEVLSDMSDLQLIYAIADYPFFGDLYAYGIDESGLATFAMQCSAFQELSSRDSFLSSLNTFGPEVAREYSSDPGDELNPLRAELILDLLSFYNTSAEEAAKEKAEAAEEAAEKEEITEEAVEEEVAEEAVIEEIGAAKPVTVQTAETTQAAPETGSASAGPFLFPVIAAVVLIVLIGIFFVVKTIRKKKKEA